MAGSTTAQRARVAAPVLLKAPVTVTTHQNGMPHIRATIKKMGELATKAQTGYPIRNLATRITAHVPSKNAPAELRALYNWVRDHIRYRFDPLGMEWVQSPGRTIAEQAGDCDDMATLLAALAGALGHRWRFRTVGDTPSTPRHVQAQAWAGKQWVDLDPVLEPTRNTTAPRTDAGTFGLSAPGAEHLWDGAGNMLSGKRRHHRGLAGPTSPRDRKLWSQVPYFPPASPFMAHGGIGPMMPGAFPPIDARYRSADAPGYANGHPLTVRRVRAPKPAPAPIAAVAPLSGHRRGLAGPTTAHERELWNWIPYDPTGTMSGFPGVTLALPMGCVDERQANGMGLIPFSHPSLGAGFLRKIKKKVGGLKVVKAVGHLKVVKKGIQVAKKVGKGIKKVVKNPIFQAVATGIAQAIPGAGQAALVAQAAALAAKAARAIKAGKKVVKGVKAGVKLAKGAKGRVKHQIAAVAKQAGATALTAAIALPGDAKGWKKPNTQLASKYPKNARQIFDRQAGVFRVFVPSQGLSASKIAGLRARGGKHKGKRALSGMGAFRPTLSFSLGAAASAPKAARSPQLVAAAKKVVSAVNTFKQNHAGKPPAIALPAITAFQIAEKGLTIDGLWGTNTNAAVSWYLQGSGVAIPAIAPGLKNALTWAPPLGAQPVTQQPTVVKPPASQPSAAPVVVKPAAPPAASFNAPAGYVEIGAEAANPGLPPAGYTGPAALPAPPVAGTPVQPGAPTGGAPKPPVPGAIAQATQAGMDDGQGPTSAPVAQLTPIASLPAAADPYSGPTSFPASTAPIIDVDSPTIVDVSQPAAYLPQTTQPLPPLPVMPGPVAPLPISPGPYVGPTKSASTGSGEGVMWAAIVYLILKNRKRAA